MDCNNNDNFQTENYIAQTVMNIDRMQKRAVVSDESSCVTCNHSLGMAQYNTLPVVLYLRNAVPFTPNIGSSTTTSPYLRIESVRQERYATFSILELDATTQTYTNSGFTCLVDLACVCAMSCLEPVNVAITCDLH